jgi:hypothetical protein
VFPFKNAARLASENFIEAILQLLFSEPELFTTTGVWYAL